VHSLLFVCVCVGEDDVDWARIGMPYYERGVRRMIVTGINGALILVYLPFFASSAALGSVETIEEQFPGVGPSVRP
jgi:hypothetical protein